MIDGEDKPRTDAQVMNWLAERRLRTGSGSGSGSGSGAAPAGNDGLLAFSDELAVSGDEGYAFIGEDVPITKGTMVRMTGSMASVDDLAGLGTPASRTAADRNGSQGANIGTPRQTEKAKALDDALMAYQQMRDLDMRRK
jgi:hypothetical protein